MIRSAVLPLALLAATLTGCGAGSPTCVTAFDLRVSPASATADSTAKPPGNQQQFTASSAIIPVQGTCPIPQNVALIHPAWTNPDPIHVSISSANDSTNGLATCKGPTGGPLTLTATYVAPTNTPTATAQLTCR